MPGLSTAHADLFAHSLHAFVGTRRRRRSTAKMNGARIVWLFPPIPPGTPSNVPTASLTHGAAGQRLAGNVVQFFRPSVGNNRGNRPWTGIHAQASRRRHAAMPRAASRSGAHQLVRLSVFRSSSGGAVVFLLPSEGGALRAEAELGDWQDSRRAAEIQCENGEVVSCTPRCAVLLQRATGKATILLCALLLAF